MMNEDSGVARMQRLVGGGGKLRGLQDGSSPLPSGVQRWCPVGGWGQSPRSTEPWWQWPPEAKKHV